MRKFSYKESEEASPILAAELKNPYITALTRANVMVEWRTIDYPKSSPIYCTNILDNTPLSSIRLSVSCWLSPTRFPTWNPKSRHGFAWSLVQKKKNIKDWIDHLFHYQIQSILQNCMVFIETIHLFSCSNELWIAIEGISPPWMSDTRTSDNEIISGTKHWSGSILQLPARLGMEYVSDHGRVSCSDRWG